MLAADSVAINRLQIKGDKRTSQALVRELEQTSWPVPLPAHLQQAWVFVRELTVTGKARDLRQQTAQQLDAQLQRAVRAVQGNAATANAVWFASLPELVAFLLVDLALGRATQWYWSRWSHLLKYSKQEAIARLLCEYSEHMPAIIMHLQSHQRLNIVWAQISDASATTLVRELARVWGFASINAWEIDQQSRLAAVQEMTPKLQTHKNLLQFWSPLLMGLDVQDARVALAATLHGLTYTPLWLHRQPAALLHTFFALVGSPDSAKENSTPRSPWNTQPIAESDWFEPQVRTEKNQPANKIVALEASPAIAIPSTPTPVAIAQRDSVLQKTQTIVTDKIHSMISQDSRQKAVESLRIKSSAPDEVSHQNPVPDDSWLEQESSSQSRDANSVEGYEFITRAGGFFYLLNPLRQLLTAERLAIQANASVWHWLLDLYRVFVQHFPALTDVMDMPLQRFILQQLHPGADAAELQHLALQALSVPPSQFAHELFADLAKQVGHTDSWQELRSSPGFFATPAQVVATASHWDIYFSMQSVRLNLRLMGWDINPGWLPWLGRVVTLHYIEQPLVAAGDP